MTELPSATKAAPPPPPPPPGWYPGPSGEGVRYWTGTEWSDKEPELPAAAAVAEMAPTRATTEVTWHGRTVALYVPTHTQLMAWSALSEEWLGAARSASDDVTDQYAVAMMARMNRIFTKALVRDEDVRWLQDLFIDGEVELEDAARNLLGGAARAVPGRPATAPTTGPVRPAARRRR